MSLRPRYRLAVTLPLRAAETFALRDNQAHYLSTVLRLRAGDAVAVFNRTDGEWQARIAEVKKREVLLTIEECLRAPATSPLHLTVCFAPIKGGRLETIIEKATELGASILQPVITSRTIVDKVNLERAEAIAREAAEQCERTDWPEIREPVKLAKLLTDWPENIPLIYGDESGESIPFSLPRRTAEEQGWAILAGPEGGFTPEEFMALRRLKLAQGVSLGPRILRADTAIITLCALTLAAWGDWHSRPRYQGALT